MSDISGWNSCGLDETTAHNIIRVYTQHTTAPHLLTPTNHPQLLKIGYWCSYIDDDQVECCDLVCVKISGMLHDTCFVAVQIASRLFKNKMVVILSWSY